MVIKNHPYGGGRVRVVIISFDLLLMNLRFLLYFFRYFQVKDLRVHLTIACHRIPQHGYKPIVLSHFQVEGLRGPM